MVKNTTVFNHMDTAHVPEIALKVLKVLLILYVNNLKYVFKFYDLLIGITVSSVQTYKLSGDGERVSYSGLGFTF